MSYLVRSPAPVESVITDRWLVTVNFSTFSSFDRVCVQTYLFLDTVLNKHMEGESYQEVTTESNCAPSLSDEDKV